MTANRQIIVSLVLIQLQPNTVVSEDAIRKLVDRFREFNPVSDTEVEEIIKELHARLAIKMDRGVCLKEKDHVSWYYAAKKPNAPFWERYCMYLKTQGFSPDVIYALDSATDEIMDMLGNPNLEMDFSRRGLVIGDVQSGKTSTYTALINKAADAGYKIIILLTGIIEKLRQQTQGRLDTGFIGLDSTAFIRDKDNVYVGVGEINPSVSGWTITSTSSDFNNNAARQFSGKLSNISTPILFVLKKNKSVLEKIEQWLRIYNADPADKKIHFPMILIDDEADTASVNTGKPDENPTAINACIRKLLKLFTRSNYVAFTATPFANIFIDPDTKDKMLGDELFPKDFIYALEAPSNYIGARDLFQADGNCNYMLKCIDDCEEEIPEGHKKEFSPQKLPPSMKEAIRSFFIANAIRDLRGQQSKHRTMLINVSRFIDVQNKLAKLVDVYVREMQLEIKNYCMAGKRALKHKNIAEIKEVYDVYFANLSDANPIGERLFTWEEIQEALPNAVSSIVVRAINGGNASKNLNYDECESGLRLIAIGGFSLSRGLTLEGLCISYFYRNSRMYDTLMQMGRWFGYREHYADVCQVWMSDDSANWYAHISEASDELRREVRRMRDQGKTPKEFGLGVRSDQHALLVTALNKMRYTEEIEIATSLDGKVVETPYIHMNKDINSSNYTLVTNWVEDLLNNGYSYADTSKLAIKQPQILGVPKEKIIELLNNYQSPLNMDFIPNDLVNVLKSYEDGVFAKWDVLIATGSSTPVTFCRKTVRPVRRSFAIRKDKKALQMSGQRSRLGGANDGKGGLDEDLKNKIEAQVKQSRSPSDLNKAFSQSDYFTSGLKRKPLLTIYPIKLSAENKNRDGTVEIDVEKQKLIDSYHNVLIGLSIGIPRIEGKPQTTYLYRINRVKLREILGVDEDYEEETGNEED